jgi:hypothetical protein
LRGGSLARRLLSKARHDDLFALETVVHSCPWLKLEVRKYEIVGGLRLHAAGAMQSSRTRRKIGRTSGGASNDSARPP